MKTFITFALLMASVSSFALDCFKPQITPTEASKLPARICVDKFGVELVIPELPTLPFYQGTTTTSLGSVTKKVILNPNAKNSFNVSLSLPVTEIDNGACGSYYSSQMVVEFSVDAKAKNIDSSLNVYAVEHESYDLCHSSGSSTVVKYVRI
jgi:hypothetical protein